MKKTQPPLSQGTIAVNLIGRLVLSHAVIGKETRPAAERLRPL
jgi:hypothetical protein